MTFLIQYDPPDGPSVLEGYDSEAAAEARAHWLVTGERLQRVVVFEIAGGEEVA